MVALISLWLETYNMCFTGGIVVKIHAAVL